MKHSFEYFITIALLSGAFAGAQVVTGRPPFGSFGGGPIDLVNLGNLNVHLSIPVLHKAGRGVPFNYDVSYDSSIWTVGVSNGVNQWQPVSNFGWRGDTEITSGYLSLTQVSTRCPGTGIHDGLFYITFSNFVYHDPFGTSHPFAGTAIDGTDCPTDNSHNLNNAVTLDGSGYKLFFPGGDSSNPQTLTAPSGLISIPPSGGASSGAAQVTDANGNQISVNTTGVFTDTLGTTALTVSGTGTPSSPKTLTYTSPTGAASVTIHYVNKTVKTNFGCTGISEFGPSTIALVNDVTLPDGSLYTFQYESTPGFSNDVTGRVGSITLATGGQIQYTYTGSNDGTVCADGSVLGLTRTITPGGIWTYSRANISGSHWKTTTSDPTSPTPNQTVIDFQQDSSSSNFYETQRLVYQGSAGGTPLTTTITCYNGNGVSTPSSCATTAVTLPINRTTVFHYLPNSSGVQSEADTTIDQFGLTDEVDEYDYAVGSVGTLLRKTITAYAALGNGIVDRPSSVTIKDGGGNVKAVTSYGFDETTPTATSGTPQHVSVTGSRGLLTSVVAQANGTTNLYRKYTYYDTGTLSSSTDVSTTSATNGAQTTYNYSATGNADCGNAFITSITEPLSLTRSMTWDCNGGVMLSLTDENGNTSSTAYSGSNYTNVFWRPYSTADQAGNVTNYFYDLNSSNQPFQTESKSATFNGGNSIVDVLTTNDSFGRTIFRQTKQGPSATQYDTVAKCYDSSGRLNFTSLPYSSAAITSSTTACPSGNAGTSYAYDALNRNSSISDTGGGSTAYTYTENDVLQTLTSPTQSKQSEYDALGRLKSVCEITSGTTAFPGGNCAQKSPQTGYWTTYTYDAIGNRTGVMQNAQASSGQQSRGYVYDMLGRLTQETNPEMNNASISYTYDSLSSDASCGSYTSAGNMVKRTDSAGNATCYSAYDALHRVGTITYPSTSTPSKYFVYDTATVNGTAMANAKTRLAEAYTCIGGCSSKVTDLGFGYWQTGQTSDVWELTPHSGTNYYYHVTAMPYPNGVVNQLTNLVGLPTITYSSDGEGRLGTASASSGQNPVTSITHDPASHVTALTYGSSDSDAFTFDPNTGRMTQYKYSVGSSPKTVTGVPSWNPNWTLNGLTITDQLNSANSQTCSYTHDALGRVASANCGLSIWSQTFSYDPFGNITKTVPGGSTGTSFQVNYDYTNNTNRITTSPFSYTSTSDPNAKTGNMTADNNHAYAWDTDGHLTGIDAGTSSGVCLTYDALGRAVEKDTGSACNTSPTSSTEIVYSPAGSKLALMNGSSLVKAFVPLPGGAQAIYNSSSLQYYRRADWLGSSRLATTTSRTVYYDVAYAPYGEPYAGSGTQDLSFTGQNQDTEQSQVPGGAAGLYDFLYHEHSPVQGRWLSPDPAGLAAANPSDPQSWNRYAYVGNRPLGATDALGFVTTPPGIGVGGGCDPIWDPDCSGCDPDFGCDCDPDFGCIPGPIIPPSGGFPGGGAPPQRKGGVWPGNETRGLPQGLNIQPLGLGSLFGLSPGTQCGDFAPCDLPGSLSNDFAAGSVAIPQAVPICVVHPELCVIAGGIALEALQNYLLQKLAQKIVGAAADAIDPNYEICYLKLDNPREGGSGFHNCWYSCQPSGRVIKRVQFGWCDPYIDSF